MDLNSHALTSDGALQFLLQHQAVAPGDRARFQPVGQQPGEQAVEVEVFLRLGNHFKPTLNPALHGGVVLPVGGEHHSVHQREGEVAVVDMLAADLRTQEGTGYVAF